MKNASHTPEESRWVLPSRIALPVLMCWLMAFTLGQSTNTAVAPAPEALVIIVNKANPVGTLSTEELRRYFRLERERWPDGRKNTVVMLPSGTPERDTVLRQIYNLPDGELNRYFLQATFAGQVHSAPKELASTVNMLKFVFNVPGAIGYVRAGAVDDTVKVVRIDGRLPGDPDYLLKLSSP